jgi:predicted outer membrane repeat protein
MLLTSWIRALRQTFQRRRSNSRVRRQAGSTGPLAPRKLQVAEILEDRSLLSALVFDNATFFSTASTPGINITNSTLDTNNDGISDYDNVVIASSDAPIVVSGSGAGIQINLSNLTGLKHITIENVVVTAGATFRGISVTLDNVPVQTLTIDQVTVNANNANGVFVSLANIATEGGTDFTVKDSTVVATNSTAVQLSLSSTTQNTRMSSVIFADSTLEGISVTSTAGASFVTQIDETSVKNVRVQDGSAVPNPRNVTYTLNRTRVGDLRGEEIVALRGFTVTATDSPIQALTIANNANINLAAAGATNGINISATTTAAAAGTSLQSDITNLLIQNNTIVGNIANANTVNGIVLTMTDANLGSYANQQAGGTITGNVIRNLSSATNTAVGLQITATASRTFVNGNLGRPLLLDFDGDVSRDDRNGIRNNLLTPAPGAAARHINGQGFVINTTADTSFRGDITDNTIQNINREGMSLSFRDRPSTGLANLVTGITATATTLPFVNPNTLPTTLPFVVQVENEQMLVTAVSGSNLTVTRGFNGTAAVAHTGSSVNPLRIERVISAGQLTSNLSATANLLTLTQPISLPATPFLVQVEQELMRVTAISGNTLAVTRGVNGTTAAAHAGSMGSPIQVSLIPNSFDSYTLNIDNNLVNTVRRAGIDMSMINTSVGSFSITNNEITFVEDVLANTPDGLSVSLIGTNVTQEATNVLKKSFIDGNRIGITSAGGAGQISGNGLFLTVQEQSQVQDLHIRNNNIRNSLQNGILFERLGQSSLRTVNPEAGQLRAVTIDSNTLGNNALNGLFVNASNGNVDLLDFEIRDNFIGTDSSGANLGNGGDGINLLAQADARLLVDIVNNTIRFNNSDGIETRTIQNSTSDKRQIGGTWIKNTISNNSGNGILVTGRYGLFDEATGRVTPIFIGLEGSDPVDLQSRGNLLEDNGQFGLRVIGTTNPGSIGFTNNQVRRNLNGGINVSSPSSNASYAIKNNIIESNFGIGLDLNNTGTMNVTVRDNLITNQANSAGGVFGDGVEISSTGGVMSLLMTNNFIDSNAGRGIDILNGGSATLQMRIGDGTTEGRNSIIGNNLEGLYVVNSADAGQSQNQLSTVPLSANGSVFNRPDIMMVVDTNVIQDNGFGGGFSGSGLVLRAGSVGSDGGNLTSPGAVGSNSGAANAGNGRINARIVNNQFGGNFGDDFYVEAFLSSTPTTTGGTWDSTTFAPNNLQRDPLSRVNMVFQGNSGNGMDVQNGAGYTNADPFKSRLNSATPAGPFGSTSRFRSVTNLRADDVPNVGPGANFVYEGLGPSTWRVEAGFDETNANAIVPSGFGTNPGNQNNFNSFGTLWDVVPSGTFSFPNVDSPSFLTANITVVTNPSPSPINQIRITFSEYVTGVDINDFELRRNGVVVPLIDMLSMPLSVLPDATTEDPNHPGAFKSYTIDISSPTSMAADYELRLLTTDTVSPIRDVLTQVNGSGNPLTPLIDMDGVLQGYAAFLNFTVDNISPSATIGPISPSLRNSAAGIVTVQFDEDVTNLDITDFVLLRDGQPVSLGSVSVVPISASTYTLNLNQFTGASGNYELRLVSADDPATPTVVEAITPVRDIAGNLVNAASITWTVDTALPFVSSMTMTTTPAGIVTGASNATPIVVTSPGHGLTNGSRVVISGVVGNAAANGTFTVKNVTANTFELFDASGLNPVSGSGAYISGGQWSRVIPSPSNVPVSALLVNFSEAVTGVTLDDFVLTRVDPTGVETSVVLAAPITLFQNSPTQFELDLSTVSGLPGTYTLTLKAVDSGIFDLAGNAFETSFSTSWVLDLAAPLADIVDVAPDPRQAPVDALNTIFSEPVTGLTIGQYVLAYDDGTSATAGTVTNATNAPTIVVTSNGHGLTDGTQIVIYGVQGNLNANGIFHVRNVTANTFELYDATNTNPVPGNGLYSGGGRWARTVSLGASTLSQETSIRYVANLSGVTGTPGTYIVSLLANAGAVDQAGNALNPAPGQFNVAAQDIWTYGADVAPVGTITPLPPTIGTNAGVITISFSEPLQKIGGNTPVDLSDFRLRRNTGSGFVDVPLTGAVITQTSATTFALDLTATGLTDINGSYELSLLTTDATTPIRDLTGNLLSETFATGIASQITWSKIAVGPSVTSITGVFNDGTNPATATKLRSVQTLTINFSVPVNFTQGLSDASQYFRLTRQSVDGTGPLLPVSLDGLAITQVTPSQYRINVNTLTGADGRYVFTVLASNNIRSIGLNQPLLNSSSVNWTKDATIHIVPDDANNATNPNKNANAVLTDGTDSTALGNEVIRTSSGRVTLRAAIQETNALPGPDVIELGVGTYVLTLGGVLEDFAVSGDLDIRDTLTIRGKGVGQTIIDASGLPAAQRDRIFQVMAGASLTLQGVTLIGGSVLGSEDGGAIRNAGTLNLQDVSIINNASQDDAGALFNTGVATIHRTTFENNTSLSNGGAIRNTGTLTITNSTIANNTSARNGGGLQNIVGATATLEGVTISGNRATSGNGGGISNDGTIRLINTTIASNQSLASRGPGAGIANMGTATIGNTILADNSFTNTTLDDAGGTFVSLGGNIVRTLGSALGFGALDQLNANPNLQPLGNYGGPTQTHAILLGSIAIDRGLNANVSATTTTDQRGAPRFLDGPSVGNAVDVGAVEFGAFFVNTTADSIDVNPGDGLAQDGLGQTSLRAAIMEANALVGDSAILLDGQVYQLNRLAPDTTAPVITSILGVPTAPITTGSVGVVTITFSEDVAGFDLADLTLTRDGTPIPLTSPSFTLTQVSGSVYTINLSTATAVNGFYQLTVNAAGANIRDREGNAFVATNSVNWVRGTDTTAPTVTISPVVNQPVTNAGIVTVTFSERVNGVSLNNFSLTRNGTPVPLTGVTLTNVQDANFNGRTVVTLNLTNVSAPVGNYVLTLNPMVGTTTTIRDTANNNLVGTTSVSWTKADFVQFAPITSPRTSAVTTVTLQFSEPVANLSAGDFTLDYDDGSGLGFQPVAIINPTLTPVPPLTAVTGFGNAAVQWTLTFTNNEAARDGLYRLNFDGTTGGKVLVTTTGATFSQNLATLNFQIGENQSRFGDLDILGGAAGGLQIIGVGKDLSANSLGVNVNPTVIDGLNNDRLFDLAGGANVSISRLEMRNGRVVFERSGGGIRNLGTLTINDSDLLSSFADGNGGGISNGDNVNVGTLTINRSTVAMNSAGSNALSQFGKGGAIFNDNGSVTIADVLFSSNSAFTDGGVIYNDNNTTVLITSSTLSNNSARRDGGAIYMADLSTLTVLSTIFSGNRADSDGNGDGEGGAVYVETNSTVQMNNNIFRSNVARIGGALYNDDATFVLNDNLFELNQAVGAAGGLVGQGGAIYNSVGGTLTLNNGLFTTNSSTDDGGAIQNYGVLTISGAQFLLNVAGTDTRSGDTDNGRGGAIYNEDGTLTVTDVTFEQNHSFGDAGAIYNQGDGLLTMTRSSFLENTADGHAGAIYNNDFSRLTIDRTRFTGNAADLDGGALYNNSQFVNGTIRSATITASTFNENTARHGGAIFNADSSGLTVENSTLSANIATISGGGLTNFGTASLTNATLYLNEAPNGAGIASNLSGASPLATVRLTNTIVAGGTLADLAGFNANFINGGHNLIGNIGAITTYGTVATPLNGNLLGDSITPRNPQLDVLKDNGGPTLTHALLFGSPARDAGDNLVAPTTGGDQRGFTRIFDGDGDGIATVDIGAFESGFIINSFSDTVDENINDGINADRFGVSTLRATIMQANARPGEDTIILSPGVYTLTLTGRSEDGAATGDLDITDTLNIIGAGTDQTFINGNQIDRIFQVFPGVSLTLSNLTLIGGNASTTGNGGAILNQGTVTLRNVHVLNGSAARGGGIYNDTTGVLDIQDSLFRGNTAAVQGGAIYNDGNLRLANSQLGVATTLTQNLAASLAATTVSVADVSQFPSTTPFVIQIDGEQMRVTAISGNQLTVVRAINGALASHVQNTLVTQGNFSNAHGGGIYNLGTATVTESFLVGNIAASRGGGIYNAASTSTLAANVGVGANTITVANAAQFPTTPGFVIQVDLEQMRVTAVAGNVFTVTRAFGGTVAAAHTAGALVTSIGLNVVDVSKTTFADNFASSRGAAIYNEDDLNITNSTLSTNKAGTNAGIGNTLTGQVDIRNSTIVDNVAFRGGGLANTTLGQVTVKNTIVANNLATTLSGVTAPNVRGVFTTAGNNFIGNSADSVGFSTLLNDQIGSATSPFDPVIAGLANNGGPTLTHAPRNGSPVLDAGDNTGGDTQDQRGATRPTNDDSDIGAVERQDIHLVSISDVTQAEGNSGSTIFRFTLTLNQASVQEVRINYSLQGDTAFVGEDFLDAGITTIGTLTAGVSASDTTFTINANSVFPNVPFTIRIDQEQLRVNSVSGNTLTVTRGVNGTLPSAHSASAIVEALNLGTVVFAPNTLTQTIDVVVNGDTSIEENEQFFVNLFNPVNVTLDDRQAIGTIVTDDSGFRILDVSRVEQDSGTQTYTFTVSVIGAPISTNQSLQYIVSSSQGALTAAVPDTVVTQITVNNPSAFPTSGQFTVQIGSEQMRVTGVAGNVFTVIRGFNGTTAATHAAGVAVTLVGSNVTANNVLVADTTITVADASTFPTVGGFAIQINNEKMQVVSVAGNVFSVQRGFNGTVATTHTAGTTVTLVRANAAAEGGANPDFVPQLTPTTLTFVAPGGGMNPAPQSFTVTVNSDNLPETNETFFVHLTGNTLPFEFGKSIGVGTIFNDDLGFNVSSASATEGDPPTLTPMNFTVSLQHPVYTSVANVPTPATTTASVSTTSGSATAGVDFQSITNQVLTFSPGTTSQTLTVNVIGDLRFEIPETFQVQVTAGTINGTADADVGSLSNSGTGTIIDNDPGPDVWRIFRDFSLGDDVVVTFNGVEVQRQNYAAATGVTVFGGNASDDLFVVDFINGNPIPNDPGDTGIVVDGQGQVAADALQFINGSFVTVEYFSVDANSGSVLFDGMSLVTYFGLEPIIDDTDAVTRIFNAPAANGVPDNIVVEYSNDSISISSVIGAGTPTFESITARAPTSTLIINGNADNNTILGSSSDPDFLTLIVNGGAGADTINLSGWTLGATINGGNGNDTLTGGSGADLIDGGNDNDSILAGSGNDTILGGSGQDTLSGQGGNDVIDGGDENDSLTGGDGQDFITGGLGDDNIDGGNDNDTVDGGIGNDTVAGGAGADTVLGNDGNDSLSGGSGNDLLDGGFGDDTLSGDAGTDTINGQSGDDVVVYIADANMTLTTISPTMATIVITGGETETLENVERARLIGGASNNRLDASAFTSGSVTLMGGAGADTLLGGSFDDVLDGGTSTNFTGLDDLTLASNLSDGNDSIVGGDGRDTINGRGGNDTIVGGLGDDYILGGTGNDTVDGQAGNDYVEGNDGVDSLLGGTGLDTLDGGAGNDRIFGNDDADSLLGGADQDYIEGGNGNDTIEAGAGNDTAFGQDGDDYVGGNEGNDTLQGNQGADSVNGNDGNDTLDGNEGNDTLFGGAGDDLLISTQGNDQLLGQGGNDSFTFEGSNTLGDIFTITVAGNGFSPPTGIGLARLNPGFEFTTILLGVEFFTLNLNGGNDLVTLGDLTDVLDLNVLNINGGAGDDTIDGALSASPTVALRVFLGLGNDSVIGTSANDTIVGDAGNDTILGGDGEDSILGLDGNDSLNGNGGNDTINGGKGDDSMLGGAGNDSLLGLDNNDTIWGQGGNDTIDGGIGNDFLDGGYGNATTGGTGDDSIRGGAGNDKIAGRDGNDTLDGGDGNDTIKGGEGNDNLIGGNGNDLMVGEDGNDTMNGGNGNDYMLGGFGNDSMLGGAGNDSMAGQGGDDFVDGQGGTDKVMGGDGDGTNTKSAGDVVRGSTSEINEVFKLIAARPNLFNELNF